MQRRISIFNMKGGTGKSTLAVNLAHALALGGLHTLLIDCDLQGNASSIAESPRTSITNVLTSQAQLSEAITRAREHLDVITADRHLNDAANYIVSKGRKAYTILRRAVQEHATPYDVILFDHSPSYSSVTETALLASTELLIPCELAPYPIEGLLDMFNKLGEELDDHELVHEAASPSVV